MTHTMFSLHPHLVPEAMLLSSILLTALIAPSSSLPLLAG